MYNFQHDPHGARMGPKDGRRRRPPQAGTWVDGVWVEPDLPEEGPTIRDTGFQPGHHTPVPFQPGNEHGLVHGAQAPAHVNPLAQVMIGWLMSLPDMPWLAEARYQPTIVAWADAESRCQLLRAYADQITAREGITETVRGTEKEDRPAPGAVKRTIRHRKILAPLQMLDRLEGRALALRKELGLTPMSAAKLGATVAGAKLDLAKLWAQMDEDDRSGGAAAV